MSQCLESLKIMVENGFAGKFCKKFGCRPEDFEHKVLWRCLPPWTYPLAWPLWLADRKSFAEDLDLIDEIRDVTGFSQVRDIISFYRIQPRKKHYLRQWLKIRMSKSRLQKLAKSVLRSGQAV